MSNELVRLTTKYSVDKCLTTQCNECSGSYINRFTGFQLRCNCRCHNKEMLEQQVVEPACSNISSENQSLHQQRSDAT